MSVVKRSVLPSVTVTSEASDAMNASGPPSDYVLKALSRSFVVIPSRRFAMLNVRVESVSETE